MIKNRQVLLAKIEANYNVDAAPVPATDAILVHKLDWKLAGLRMNAQDAVRPSLGKLEQLYGGTLVELTFEMDIKGSGAAGTAPEMGVPLRCCGLGETISAGISVAYAPVSVNLESATFYLYEDGLLYPITGCRGEVAFDMEGGKSGVASFTITGHLGAHSDTALPSPTLDNTAPPTILSAGFSAGGYAAVISKLAFSMGIKVSMPPDINAADGFGEVLVTERDVNGSFDPEVVTVATNDFLGDFKGRNAMTLATGVIGAAAGNQYAVSMPAISYRNLAPGDRDGLRTYTMSFGAAESVGDDEVTITFT